MNDLISWLRTAVAAREESVRKLLVEAQRVQLALKDPKLLGRHMPGWYSWPDVEALCNVALREVQAHRAILDALEAAEARQKVERRNYQRWIDGKPDKQVPDGPPEDVIAGLRFAAKALVSIYSDRDGYNPEWSA